MGFLRDRPVRAPMLCSLSCMVNHPDGLKSALTMVKTYSQTLFRPSLVRLFWSTNSRNENMAVAEN